ncbi:helix-turn-helix domain-containing protein [Streptomyces sp. NPDC060334]|uniref:helix-turn-helix domain-containing protein n=1 Tax=Streptomyces sp. NPDC060334 TaxID=3347099 RepID=UPI003666774B
MSHRNARLTVFGRRLLIERVASGRPVAHVAAEMGISRATAHKRMRRWRAEGEDVRLVSDGGFSRTPGSALVASRQYVDRARRRPTLASSVTASARSRKPWAPYGSTDASARAASRSPSSSSAAHSSPTRKATLRASDHRSGPGASARSRRACTSCHVPSSLARAT